MKQDLSHSTQERKSPEENSGSMPLKTNGLWIVWLEKLWSILLTFIHQSPEVFSFRESSVKMQKSSSLPDRMSEPYWFGQVPDLASSHCIHGTCQGFPIQPHSQPSSLASPALLLPSQDLAGLAPSLCMFTTKSSVSCSLHWLISLSFQILLHHEIYHLHQDTSESEKETIYWYYTGTTDIILQI